MFENFEENHVLLRPGAKVTQFYADGVDYALADGTTDSLRGYDNIVLAMGSRSNTALKDTAEKVAGQVLVRQGSRQRGSGHRRRAGSGAEDLTSLSISHLFFSPLPIIRQERHTWCAALAIVYTKPQHGGESLIPTPAPR